MLPRPGSGIIDSVYKPPVYTPPPLPPRGPEPTRVPPGAIGPPGGGGVRKEYFKPQNLRPAKPEKYPAKQRNRYSQINII